MVGNRARRRGGRSGSFSGDGVVGVGISGTEEGGAARTAGNGGALSLILYGGSSLNLLVIRPRSEKVVSQTERAFAAQLVAGITGASNGLALYIWPHSGAIRTVLDC